MNGHTENFSIWAKSGCMRRHKKHPEWKLPKSRLHHFGESSSPQKSAAFYNLLVILWAPSASKCLRDFIWEIASVLQVDIFGLWQVLRKAVAVMEELKETFFCVWGGGQSDVHYPRAANRFALSHRPPSPPLSSCSWGVLSTIHNAWSPPHPCTSLSWLVPFDNSAQLYFIP